MKTSVLDDDDDDSGEPEEDDPYSSFFFKEIERKALNEAGITERELYSGNRTLGVLADFFYDSYTGRNYERGLLLKGKYDFIGKTVVVARSRINNLLTSNCQVSGLGMYKVTYCVSWIGRAEPERINDLFKTKLRDSNAIFHDIDTKLCRKLKSSSEWKYMIVDLEKVTNANDILLG